MLPRPSAAHCGGGPLLVAPATPRGAPPSPADAAPPCRAGAATAAWCWLCCLGRRWHARQGRQTRGDGRAPVCRLACACARCSLLRQTGHHALSLLRPPPPLNRPLREGTPPSPALLPAALRPCRGAVAAQQSLQRRGSHAAVQRRRRRQRRQRPPPGPADGAGPAACHCSRLLAGLVFRLQRLGNHRSVHCRLPLRHACAAADWLGVLVAGRCAVHAAAAHPACTSRSPAHSTSNTPCSPTPALPTVLKFIVFSSLLASKFVIRRTSITAPLLFHPVQSMFLVGWVAGQLRVCVGPVAQHSGSWLPAPPGRCPALDPAPGPPLRLPHRLQGLVPIALSAIGSGVQTFFWPYFDDAAVNRAAIVRLSAPLCWRAATTCRRAGPLPTPCRRR